MYTPYRNPAFESIYRTMTVIGFGEISVKPNVAKIQLEVQTEHEQMSQAQQENSYKMNQVLQAVVELGILQENIQTSSFQVRPVYDYVDEKQKFRGYEIINIITIRTNQLDQVGKIIEIALQNGVSQILDVQFSLENSEICERQAIAKALADAVGKAQTIAHQMHLNIDPIPIKIVEEITEQSIPLLKTSMAEFNSSPPIEPGLIQVQAKVHVDFRY